MRRAPNDVRGPKIVWGTRRGPGPAWSAIGGAAGVDPDEW